jgi:hypothetical protein
MFRDLNYVPFMATDEQRQQFLDHYASEYWFYHAGKDEMCQCGRLIRHFTTGVTIGPFESVSSEEWYPRTFHSHERCNISEADLQGECQGPTRKSTGAYVGCTNCEPYVWLSETRDSPYVYSVSFPEDLHMQVYDGDIPLEGVLEVKTGVGGYIIQVRQTPDSHMCPCYLLEPDDPEIEPKICRIYIPGNNFRVAEPE